MLMQKNTISKNTKKTIFKMSSNLNENCYGLSTGYHKLYLFAVGCRKQKNVGKYGPMSCNIPKLSNNGLTRQECASNISCQIGLELLSSAYCKTWGQSLVTDPCKRRRRYTNREKN